MFGAGMFGITRVTRVAAGSKRLAAVAAGILALALASCQFAGTAAGPLGATSRNVGSAGGDTRGGDTAGVVTPAPCVTGTCWVAVSVSTMWVRPWYPRSVDQPALANPARPRQWVAAMTVAQKGWLVGRLESQALYGTKVTVIGHYGSGWTKIAVPGQPTNRDSRGYPGWVPTRQLTSTPPPAAATTAIVRAATTWLWTGWSSAGVGGSKVLEISYDTMLPVVSATPSYVEVTMIGGRRLALARSAVALHVAGASWGATSAKVVAQARKFLGLQYLWAGTSGFGFDCSGFTRSAYLAYGIVLPRDADRQAAHGTPVAAANRRPGDLVFFRGSASGPISHVGMYVGNGQMIDAPNTGSPVRIESLWSSGYAGARRYLG